MELSAAFEERVRQMEDARNHRLSLLHAEKELQAERSRLLDTKLASARRLERRRLLLERRAADLASRALSARAGIDAARARRVAISRDLRQARAYASPTQTPPPSRLLKFPHPHRSVRGEIEEAERREEEWDRFYEAKRKEMEEFQAMSGWFEAAARDEVQSLRDLVSQKLSAFVGLPDGPLFELKAIVCHYVEMEPLLKISSRTCARQNILLSANAVNPYLHTSDCLQLLMVQLKSTLQEHHGGVMYLNNAEITAAEARKSDLMAKKAKLDESLASARQFRALLQQQLQKSFASQIGDQKTTQTTI
uniref:Uncharacterized protein n=1 Tax=Oryza sativa subsp. japonica TaxID=39947 RepID=Q6ESV3_ORYSJ|nr:hypothetical protein [Oryza sativa Japonica Group]